MRWGFDPFSRLTPVCLPQETHSCPDLEKTGDELKKAGLKGLENKGVVKEKTMITILLIGVLNLGSFLLVGVEYPPRGTDYNS